MQYLDFEQPIADLEEKIEALRQIETGSDLNIQEEVAKLHKKSQALTKSIFSSLSDWQIIRLARHPNRPHTLDYLKQVFTDFDELHGDRCFGDDAAIVGGLARLDGQAVMVIGQQKGRTTKEKLKRNFGMPHPEGYRKALRLMQLAERYGLPVITLIDTSGAYPGVGAEARGQSEAIATNLQVMSGLRVPIICVVIGEGCSGGAVGIGVGDKIFMLQYSYYATISPEGCASILWRSADKAEQAAEIMGITAQRLLKNNLVDEVIEEPSGGAHRDPKAMATTLRKTLVDTLKDLQQKDVDTLLSDRYQKIMAFGQFNQST